MKTTIRSGMLTGVLAAAVLSACGGDRSAAGEFTGTVRDSAGIEIVENSATGLWNEGVGWTTREEMTIGEAAGDADYQFAQIAGVDALSDGRIAVLDQQAQRVQIYDAAGAYERSVGAAGNGPGEFSPQTMNLFVGRGDTLVVPDMGNQRVTLIAPNGEPTSFPLRMELGVPMGYAMTEDGDLVTQRRAMNLGPADGPPVTDDDVVLRQAYDGTVLDTLLSPKRGGTFEMTAEGPRIELFAAEPMWTVLGDGRVAQATTDAYRIEVYGSSGLERIIEFPHETQEVTEEDERILRRLIRESMERNGVPEPAAEQMLDRIVVAERWPVFAQLRRGPAGTLWVQRTRTLENVPESELEDWNPQLDQGAPVWDVFEADGRYGGVVELPARFTPMSFGDERIYGVFRDEVDVQYVRTYRLDAGAPPADG